MAQDFWTALYTKGKNITVIFLKLKKYNLVGSETLLLYHLT